MEIPEKHRELAERHKNGAVIEVQHQNGSDVWAVTNKPLWQEGRNYRVKPTVTPEEAARAVELLRLEQLSEAERWAEISAANKKARELAELDRARLQAIDEAESFLKKVAAQQHTKVGQIIAISTGEYSDYQVKCHVRALQVFGIVDAMILFRSSGDYLAKEDVDDVDEEPTNYGASDRFISWMQRRGMVEPLEPDEVMEWWIDERLNS